MLLLFAACGRFGFGAGGDGEDPPSTDAGLSDPLSGFDDGFDGNSLDSEWIVINAANVSASQADGELSLIPTGRVGFWTSGGEGPLYYKEIVGDFSVTANVEVSSNIEPSEPPSTGTTLAGLLARDAAADARGVEDHVWIGFGAITAGEAGAEAKSIDDSATEIDQYEWPHMEAELRICRVGTTLRMLTRNGGAWQNPDDYLREDFGPSLQVGFFVQALDGTADIHARFRDIRFRTPSSAADCELD